MAKSTLKESQLAKVAALRDRFSSLYQLPPEVFSAVLDIVRGELRRKRLSEEAQKLATIAEDVYGEQLLPTPRKAVRSQGNALYGRAAEKSVPRCSRNAVARAGNDGEG